jgi:transcriptional regulator with XRE-family HTH domain
MTIAVGRKIRALRLKKGLSQEQVADQLHVSQSTYARIENGESHSWANYITPISHLFEIQPEELLKEDAVVINTNQTGGAGYIQINHLSEKLIEQYELRLQDKETMIQLLQNTNITLQELLKIKE